jgi:IS5 family transposase
MLDVTMPVSRQTNGCPGKLGAAHTLPLDRSSLTRWRQRIGAERLNVLLTESLAAARRGGAVEDTHLRRVTIDITVQPKAVTHPTEASCCSAAS